MTAPGGGVRTGSQVPARRVGGRRPLAVGTVLAATLLLPTCTEQFPSEVAQQRFQVTIEPTDWPDTVAVAEVATWRVRVEDQAGRLLEDPPLEWTVPEGLGVAQQGGLAGAEASLEGQALGAASLEAHVPEGGAFQAASYAGSVTVVLAGVEIVSATDTTLTALDDTVVVRARGTNASDETVAGVTLAWDTLNLRALQAVAAGPDSVRLVAVAPGVDTIRASHDLCRGACAPETVVTVVQAVASLAVSAPGDTLLAEDTARATAAGQDRNGHEAPDAAYTWSSSDDGVVTVDASGLITGRSTGVAYVAAEAASGVRDSMRVEVLPSGRLVAQLTDAPSDYYASAWLYVAGTYVLDPLVSQGRRYLQTTPRAYDLLALANGAADTLGAVRVPGATYGTVWLLLDSAVVELASPYTFSGGVTRRKLDPPASAADSLAVTVEGGAAVADGDSATVVVDFDVDRNFPLTSAPDAGGVIDGVTWQVRARSVVRSRAASIAGNVATADTVSVDRRRIRGVRTDVAGDTVHARSAADGAYTLWYLAPGTYDVDVPETPSCYVASPASRSITVAVGEAAGGADFSLERVVVDSIAVTPASDTLNALGDTLQLAVTAYDTLGAALVGLTFTWTALDQGVATVDGTGRVVSRSAGSGRIMVAVCDAADTAAILVRQVPATVEVTPATVTVDPGDTTRLNAAVADSNGASIGGPVVTWSSSDTAVATVDAQGLVTAVASGTANITAASGGVSGEGVVRVRLQPGTAQQTITAGDAWAGGWGCDINDVGDAHCWGSNGSGQLGDGTRTASAVPVAVAGGLSFGAIAAGMRSAHTCGLTVDGRAYCWGEGSDGQLGNGSTLDSTTPVEVAGGLTFTAIDVGDRFTCALGSSGTVYCWGRDAGGLLGTGGGGSSAVPQAVAGGATYVQLDVGVDHTCALTDAGALYCWGSNWEGKLGDGGTTSRSAPTLVVGGFTFEAMAVGGGFTCAVDVQGQLYCWGSNANSELARAGAGSLEPVESALGYSFASVFAGQYHACGILADGAAVCWGFDEYGQGGSGEYWASGPTPRVVVGNHQFTTLAVAGAHTCGSTSQGTSYCWGLRQEGNLGDGVGGTATTPTAIVMGFSIAASGIGMSQWFHACAVATNGAPYCWGSNSAGQLGDGTTANSAGPTAVSTGESFARVSTTSEHTCGLTTGGTAQCWGSNGYGQLGNGTTSNSSTPVTVSGGDTWLDVETGGHHFSCGVNAAGHIYCWGSNEYQQVGQATGTQYSVPVLVDDTRTYTEVALGHWHACGLAANGDAYCWGSDPDNRGVFGDSTRGQTFHTPRLVLGSHTFVSLSAGYEHTCGVTGDAEVYCWGKGDWGELGDGRGADASVPVRANINSVAMVSAGRYNTCAIDTAGDAYCWGDNGWGQLANGFVAGDRALSPSPIGSQPGLMTLETGGEATCAVDLTGQFYCWGSKGEFGLFGDGTIDRSAVPVQVVSH